MNTDIDIDWAHHADYRMAKPEKTRARQTAYRTANREKIRARNAAWRAANPAYHVAYYAADPEKKRAGDQLRRARVRQATPPWLTKEERSAMRRLRTEAKALGMSTDHIVPIKGKNVSGLHVPWNLQILSLTENVIKSNNHTE